MFLRLVTILWTCIIFGFSLQPAEVSSDMSGGLGRWILETFLPGIWNRLDSISAQDLELWHTVLRKCAHFSEYFMLGALWISVLKQTMIRYKRWAAVGVCVLTASIDEIIQRFVPGRSGQFKDVLLDSVGAITGILLMWIAGSLVYGMLKRNRGRKQDDF